MLRVAGRKASRESRANGRQRSVCAPRSVTTVGDSVYGFHVYLAAKRAVFSENSYRCHEAGPDEPTKQSSPGMMASARLPQGVSLVEGTAEAIPFAEASFDFLSMGYALRHIGDLSIAFREFQSALSRHQTLTW